MPTPRYHGGAAIQHFALNLPAFQGLNKQARGAVLGPNWATRMENTVLDTSNRVAARKGWSNQTGTPVSSVAFIQLAEYLTHAGTSRLIASGDDNALYASTDGGDTWSDVTDTAGVTDDNLQFAMFNDQLLGFQNGDAIVMYDGTDFEDLTINSGTQPDGGVGLAAFGRVWAVDDDLVTIRYSALLDATRWAEADGGGLIDMTNVWEGTDTVQALSEFNGSLVVFGKRNIIIWTDGAGSALGIDPEQLYVADTISGIGCIARDSVVNVKGDLWFLDDTGIHSLGRLVAEKSNPLNNISKNVQDELLGYVSASTTSRIRAVYSPLDRFYLISMPIGTSEENGGAFCFDTRGLIEDGAARCTGIWNPLVPTAAVVTEAGDFYSALLEHEGEVGLYSGYQDDEQAYIMEYESGWTDLKTPNLKLLKRLAGLFYIQSNTTVSFKWAFDFVDTFSSASKTYEGATGTAEFNVAEFNIAEFGTGLKLQEKRVGGKGKGEYIKIGCSVEIDGSQLALQQMTLYAKEGRLR